LISQILALKNSVCGSTHNISNKLHCVVQSADDCERCRHYRAGTQCVAQCPAMHYADRDAMCQPCHELCLHEAGCTGPDNGVGPGRCLDCARVQLATTDHLTNNQTIVACLPHDENCPDGYFEKSGFTRNQLVRFIAFLFCLRFYPRVAVLVALAHTHTHSLVCFMAVLQRDPCLSNWHVINMLLTG
jgi:hypothetical protein